MVIDPLLGETELGYDLAGRQTYMEDALNRMTNMRYDACGLLIETEFSDHTTVRTTYDAAGRTLTTTD